MHPNLFFGYGVTGCLGEDAQRERAKGGGVECHMFPARLKYHSGVDSPFFCQHPGQRPRSRLRGVRLPWRQSRGGFVFRSVSGSAGQAYQVFCDTFRPAYFLFVQNIMVCVSGIVLRRGSDLGYCLDTCLVPLCAGDNELSVLFHCDCQSPILNFRPGEGLPERRFSPPKGCLPELYIQSFSVQ